MTAPTKGRPSSIVPAPTSDARVRMLELEQRHLESIERPELEPRRNVSPTREARPMTTPRDYRAGIDLVAIAIERIEALAEQLSAVSPEFAALPTATVSRNAFETMCKIVDDHEAGDAGATAYIAERFEVYLREIVELVRKLEAMRPALGPGPMRLVP